MIKRKVFFFTSVFLSLLTGLQAFAQDKHPEHDAVMAVVDQFFEALNSDNQSLMASITIDGSIINTVREQEDGSFVLRSRQQDNGNLPANRGEYTERYWDEILLVNNQMAVFWAPYDFYIDGEFSHCGVDVFDLIKLEGVWKLASSMYTVIRNDCPPSPLGKLR